MTNDSQQPEAALADEQEQSTLLDESNPSSANSTLEVEGLDPNGVVNVVSHSDPVETSAPEPVTVVSSDQVQVIEALQLEVDALKQTLAQQTQQFDAQKTQSIRIAADFDNFRKRTQREKEELEYLIKRNTIVEILSVVDNFERARAQIKPESDGEMTIHRSYQGVYKNLVDSLKRLGVSAMRPEGDPFDPNFHEAMFREQTDAHPEGTVIEQLQRGYLLNDRVLRHAMVKVAAPPEVTEAGIGGVESDNNLPTAAADAGAAAQNE
ncbi:MAG: nucleotide exchange factor GrpE [Spirulina sp. SIO3F2]|nr:nucleotide exchange factor GrpE [Spirulina sp. SIO3F2]